MPGGEALAGLSEHGGGNRVRLVQHYPAYLDLRGRTCVVVGGGEIAERKVKSLLGAGARVTVIGPTLTPGLAALAETHEIMHHGRTFRRGDLAGAVLAYAATDDQRLHIEIAAEASETQVLLNVVDCASLCSFLAPAVIRRGPVSVAVSTGGASPALAKRLSADLEKAVGPEYGLAATILGKLRPIVAAIEPEQAGRARVFAALVDSPLIEALRAGDAAAIDDILTRTIGSGTTLEALGISLAPGGGRSRDDGTRTS